MILLVTLLVASMVAFTWGVIVAIWRFTWIRPRGIPMCTAVHHDGEPLRWRHGVVILGESKAKFYLLRSLRLRPDLISDRRRIQIVGRRDVKSGVVRLLADPRIIELQSGDFRIDLAGGHALDMALVAWLESAPSTRIQRLTRHPRRGREQGNATGCRSWRRSSARGASGPFSQPQSRISAGRRYRAMKK